VGEQPIHQLQVAPDRPRADKEDLSRRCPSLRSDAQARAGVRFPLTPTRELLAQGRLERESADPALLALIRLTGFPVPESDPVPDITHLRVPVRHIGAARSASPATAQTRIRQ
jgi:hypothetical protein